MRNCFVGAGILILSATNAAAESSSVCAAEGVIASTVMGHRQLGGWGIDEMMERLGSEPGLREMILEAYAQPRMQTPQTRQMMIDEFANKWSVACYRDGSVLKQKG